MVGPIVPIGVMLGKADTAFKMVGGSSIVFNIIRSRIFGKVLRAVEYPDGDLCSFKIYRMNLYRLKGLIADTQPPPFPTAFLEPEDIKQVSVFTSPHFTEPIRNDSNVSALPDNAWLFWSKDSFEEDPIPTRGVKLDGSHVQKKPVTVPELQQNELVLQDQAIAMARRIRESQQFSQREYDRVIDLAVDRDAGLLAISRNFGSHEEEFRRHCSRMLQRRDPRSILMVDGGTTADGRTETQEAEDGPRRNIEPQVELTSRE